MLNKSEYIILLSTIEQSGLDCNRHLDEQLLNNLLNRELIKRHYMNDYDQTGWYDITSKGRLELNLYEKENPIATV